MTSIYIDYAAFSRRENKDDNGVSPDFAKQNPDFEKMNESNKGCWNCAHCAGCTDCARCAGCSRCIDCARCAGCSRCTDCARCAHCAGCTDCAHCAGCTDCARCAGCTDCARCSRCTDCARCAGCSRCTDQFDQFDQYEVTANSPRSGAFAVPVLPGIHQTVLQAVERPEALNMENWHSCDTTHCRGGWVVHLAGEAGAKLEKETSTLFAAMQIYKASSPIRVSPGRFFDSNDEAMADIRRCAEEEAAAAGAANSQLSAPNSQPS